MKKKSKTRALSVVSLIVALTALSFPTVTYASGADVGTVGQGSTYFPTASPYISYAHVTQCNTDWGPKQAYTYRGKVSIGSTIAFGPTNAYGDGDSLVTLRRVAALQGSWFCQKLS
ncbi:hypothetical protein GCM10009860_14660 [Microbacterium mitrae]